ncbi:unnamed protein product, partial [Closterium sp. NIES-53]
AAVLIALIVIVTIYCCCCVPGRRKDVRDMEKGGEEEKLRQMVREASSAAAAKNASERKSFSQGNGATDDGYNGCDNSKGDSARGKEGGGGAGGAGGGGGGDSGGGSGVDRGSGMGMQETPVAESTNQSSLPRPMSVRVFSFAELAEATNNFDHANYLGEGGFGRVYRGRLKNGQEVAVKRLTRLRVTGSGRAKGGGGGGGQGEREFVVEVEMLSRLHHRNLVKLIGYCASHHHQLLCYELVPNGSLEAWLHGMCPSCHICFFRSLSSRYAWLHGGWVGTWLGGVGEWMGVHPSLCEFVVEVEMLSRLHHRNLVKLIGYCASHHHQLLCYELVPNGSLEAWLHVCGGGGDAEPPAPPQPREADRLLCLSPPPAAVLRARAQRESGGLVAWYVPLLLLARLRVGVWVCGWVGG